MMPFVIALIMVLALYAVLIKMSMTVPKPYVAPSTGKVWRKINNEWHEVCKDCGHNGKCNH